MTETTRDEFGEKPTSDVKSRSSASCLLYGCLFSFLFMILLVVGGGFTTYWFLKGQLHRYTSETAADLPTVELGEEAVAEIETRVKTFKEEIESGEATEDLVLTADEINALISKDDDFRGRVYVTIAERQVSGEVSIPVDAIPGGKGRYFNAAATFTVSLNNGVLVVTLDGAKVKGEEVPQEFIDAMKKENLAKDLYKDPEVAEMLGRIESLTIDEDRVVLKPRRGEKPTLEQKQEQEADAGAGEASKQEQAA